MIKFIELCSSILEKVISHYLIQTIDRLLSLKKQKQEPSDSKDEK